VNGLSSSTEPKLASRAAQMFEGFMECSIPQMYKSYFESSALDAGAEKRFCTSLSHPILSFG
jgi:hypothetical protein